jgi:hypothetical protein
MTGYEIFGLVLTAIFASSLLYAMWKIAQTIKEE